MKKKESNYIILKCKQLKRFALHDKNFTSVEMPIYINILPLYSGRGVKPFPLTELKVNYALYKFFCVKNNLHRFQNKRYIVTLI